jgi:transposase
MHIAVIPNRNSSPTILLRRCWRDGKRVRKETLANMTKWPPPVVDAVRRALKGEQLVSVDQVFSIQRSFPHGHVQAILTMIRRLGLDSIIAAKRSRRRDLVVGMLVERLIEPCSKLATTRLWKESTLAGQLDIEDADVDELYEALAWLLERQRRIEKKLAKRHLAEGSLALYDVTSTYFEGRTCPLLEYGHNRDGRPDRPQIVYGIMTDAAGRPVSVQVYPGSTGDPSTVADQVEKAREDFGLDHVVLVGDRGMLTQARIGAIREHPRLGWISALRSEAIRSLAKTGAIQMSLFDERNLAEIVSPDFPGERLVVCLNPALAEERKRKRDELLDASETALAKIEREIKRRTRTPLSKEEIAMKLERALGRRKMKKHFTWKIDEGLLEWSRNEDSIAAEASLDGVYVIRTSEPKERLTAEDTVRQYKSLSLVERAFRTLKGVELRVRPIFHRLEDSVRAHVFLCMLAYYVEWHMRRAWASLLFDDEELEQNRMRRDPVAPAESSASAKKKKATRKTRDGHEVHSFKTLLGHLSTQCLNRCLPRNAPDAPQTEILSEPTPLQTRALELIEAYPVSGN